MKYYDFLRNFILISNDKKRAILVFWVIESKEGKFVAEIRALTVSSEGSEAVIGLKPFNYEKGKVLNKRVVWKEFKNLIEGEIDDFVSIAPPTAIPESYKKSLSWWR